MKAIRMAAPEGETIPKDVNDIDRHKMLFFGKYHPIAKPWIRKEVRHAIEGAFSEWYEDRITAILED